MKKWIVCLCIGTILILACSCNERVNEKQTMVAIINEKPFGAIGRDTVIQYTLTNAAGMQVSILNYGGTVTNILVPDRDQKMGDVVLGFDSLSGYLQKNNPYFGCLVGRYANRISKGKFTIGNNSYQLPLNDNGNTLHGGIQGLDKVIWKADRPAGDSSLRLQYTSKDGDQGFPGNLKVTVVYTLTADNGLQIAYSAITDKATPVNLTNHSYFNLSGGKEPDILNHKVMIDADRYTEVNKQLIPTGKLLFVKGTPMDFTIPKLVGKEIDLVNGGYDHNWVLNRDEAGLKMVATVHDTASGRYLQVYTTEPGMQFYTGNFLDGSLLGKGKWAYGKHAALCLETQHFPDGPNQPGFPNTILQPGETYQQVTRYVFSVK